MKNTLPLLIGNICLLKMTSVLIECTVYLNTIFLYDCEKSELKEKRKPQ